VVGWHNFPGVPESLYHFSNDSIAVIRSKFGFDCVDTHELGKFQAPILSGVSEDMT
jgi:hypothetical protein